MLSAKTQALPEACMIATARALLTTGSLLKIAEKKRGTPRESATSIAAVLPA